MFRMFSYLFVLVAASHLCLGQNGYNYPRPEGPIPTGSNAIPTGGSTPIRPAGAFPAAPAAAFPSAAGFPATSAPSAPAFGFSSAARPAGPGPSAGGFPTAGGFSQPASALVGGRPGIPSRGGGVFSSAGQTFSTDGSYEGDYSAIPGTPGVDYPVFAETPQTSFDCQQQQFPGYYSDVEARCQVFHICALNRTYSFLCPNGTIFSQATLVCVWWNQFDCASAPNFYPNNAFIYDYTQTGENRAGGGAFPGATSQVGIPTGSGRPQSPGATFSTGGRTPGGFPSRSGASSPAFPAGTGPGTTSFPGTPGAQIPTYPGTSGSQGPQIGLPTGPGFPGASGTTASAAGFPVPNPSGFGTTVRPAGFPQADAAFPSTAIATTTSNREYLPPRRA